MNLPLESIKSLLGAAAAGTITLPDVTRLVQVSRVVVQTHLRSKKAALPFLFHHHGISETDLAYDCLGEVFTLDGGRRYPKIEQLTRSLGREFVQVDAPEVFIAYRGLLMKIADAHIAHLYALADPEGGRIYRNIKAFVRKTSLFSIRRSPEGLALAAGEERPGPRGRRISEEDLEREILRRRGRIHSTPDLLGAVHEILAGSEPGQTEVLLLDVVKVMKRLHGDGLEEAAWNVPPDIDGLLAEDIGRIRSEVLRQIRTRIARTYLDTGKVTPADAAALEGAIGDVVADWCEGSGEYRSLSEYLGRHLPVTPDEYETRFKSKLEYLVKLARESCEALLLREL